MATTTTAPPPAPAALVQGNCCAPAPFSFTRELVNVLKASISFIMALALNEAFSKTFGLIKIGGNAVGAAWIYAVIIIGIGILGLFGLAQVPP